MKLINIVQKKGTKMKTFNKTTEIEDMKINVKMKLSALWVAMMLLYIYADILSLFRPGQIEEMREGLMGPFPVTQASLLVASILMIIPAVMVFLSLTLKPKVARWANIAVGVLYTVVNISNLIGEAWVYYIVFGIVEIMLTLLIVSYAWTWANPEVSPHN
jgi:cbb3-type cytochrome oxidase subunit 3